MRGTRIEGARFVAQISTGRWKKVQKPSNSGHEHYSQLTPVWTVKNPRNVIYSTHSQEFSSSVWGIILYRYETIRLTVP
jgi:hypothetical protein